MRAVAPRALRTARNLLWETCDAANDALDPASGAARAPVNGASVIARSELESAQVWRSAGIVEDAGRGRRVIDRRAHSIYAPGISRAR
jgi:hypothetical protein